MKRNKGFSLLEVIASIFIFTILSLSVFPAFIKVYNERITIRQENVANESINETLQRWLFENQLPDGVFEKDDILFQWSVTQVTERDIKVCLSWSSKNGRDYEKCGYAKK
ncbi:type II secretion system protein [Alkalihalobacterium chitinilyticum]|uniref:Type II secretion system GspH family protein n=1 Tax=Alkalihalobacterium chitinilyticum TaxID=2980103 RepID=A0ABT5VA00_9BACI|nr:type II secretion system protein [Alkalihalobacterium chitinilyticum]MDE5412286.1 type II secretion system GspH family protein [Alkalihalobacterium chitinilyticum]